ncbi:tetratricopeptide repeat protein [Flavicella sediminum]|uniref:tetratricopeptide repeat protein n=1 Tax=Flavicella sediminum TaxID=2585141 RepID=UPI00140AC998|nr:tetratricopeptide repeat protein [Flavicella sediminum]
MKIVQLLIVFLFCFTVNAQQDTIAQQRLARKFVREGNTLYKQNNFVDAAVSYTKGIEQNATYHKAAHNLGNAFVAQKNYKEALPQFELAVKGAKTKLEKAASYHNIGNVHMAQKEFEKAIEAFKNSLRNNPSDEETRYNLAHAKQQLKKEKEEEEKNKKDPPSDFAKRMKKKADELLAKFKFKEALEVLDKALEKDMTVSNYNDYMKKLEEIIEIKK